MYLYQNIVTIPSVAIENKQTQNVDFHFQFATELMLLHTLHTSHTLHAKCSLPIILISHCAQTDRLTFGNSIFLVCGLSVTYQQYSHCSSICTRHDVSDGQLCNMKLINEIPYTSVSTSIKMKTCIVHRIWILLFIRTSFCSPNNR